MRDVTIEIAARLNDEASAPMEGLTALADRLNAALELSRERLAGLRQAADALSGAAKGADGAFAMSLTAAQSAADGLAASAGKAGNGLTGMAQAGAKAQSVLTSALHADAAAADSLKSALNALAQSASRLSGRFSTTGTVQPHARGGILTKPHLGLVAEDGPEAIIPLGADKRERGIELLRAAGRSLGVREYAMGGVPDTAAHMVSPVIEVGGVTVTVTGTGTVEEKTDPHALAEEIADAIARSLERAVGGGFDSHY